MGWHEASDAQKHLRGSRRSLLKGAAALTALSALPWSMRQALADDTHALLVIGAGTAGMAAAIFAAQRGAHVVVVEGSRAIGGTLMYTGGNMGAAGTVFQRARGIRDTPQQHYDDVMRISRGTAIAEMTRLWVEHAGGMVDWLAGLGLRLPEDGLSLGVYDHYAIARYHGPENSGRSIFAVMQPEFERFQQAGRITLMTEARALELILDPRGQVRGAVVQDRGGLRSDVRARKTIIATGGCASNPALFEALHGVPLYRRIAAPTSTGDGLLLGLGVGGQLRCAGNYVGYHGAIVDDEKWPFQTSASMVLDPRDRPPWELYVNARGERFMREDLDGMSARNVAMDRQPGHRFWAVFDQATLDAASSLVASWDRRRLDAAFDRHPMCHRAESWAELGVRAGIDPAGLHGSVADYNASISAGSADRFGREYRPRQLQPGPLYAIRSQTWTLKSYAGLTVDEELRLLDGDGDVIPGLYAAGEVLGAVAGGKAHTNGASLTPALTFGKLLGERLSRPRG